MERGDPYEAYTTPVRGSSGNPPSLTMLEFLDQFPPAPFDQDQ